MEGRRELLDLSLWRRKLFIVKLGFYNGFDEISAKKNSDVLCQL
jgi:hypothetical protein